MAVAILDNRPIGPRGEHLQLDFLHVSRDYRGTGLGKRLFQLSKMAASARGARYLYISATPSQQTIDFYIRQRCRMISEPDPALLALEPLDIHMECPL